MALLTGAPAVPPPIDRDKPARVIVRLQVVEQVRSIAEEVFAIEDAVPREHRDRLRVVLVSFDQRDTPARLRQLAEREIPLDRWTLATASSDHAREIAAALGIKYRKLDSGEYFHSSIITVLDEDGHPRARVEGFGAPSDAMVAAIVR